MSQSHHSFFTYAVTRPFPFKWYTPVVVVGGVILTVFLTFLNLSSSGYDLIVQTSIDPNATVSHNQLPHRWSTSLTRKTSPVCQPIDLPVNGQFFTNQTALTYTLTAIWQRQDNHTTILPSLIYHNNILESCSVTSIGVDFQALDQAANQFSYAEWNAIVRTYATCQVSNSFGNTFINLTQTYNYVPPSISFLWVNNGFLGTEFLARDKQARPSLWWGESLLSNYWAYSTRLMQDIRANRTEQARFGIRKGSLYFTPTGATDDLTDLDFFKPDYRFILDFGGGRYDVISPRRNTTISLLDRENIYPNIWIPVDALAKSAYSTVLVDLGQANKPNILTNAKALQHFTANLTAMQRHLANAEPGPERDPFHAQRNTTGLLGVVPSVISTRYLCQVPRLKPTGNLIVAVLIANLVLLQAAWQLFKLGTEMYLEHTRPSAMSSEGCASSVLDSDIKVVTDVQQPRSWNNVLKDASQTGYTTIPLDNIENVSSSSLKESRHV